MPRTFGPLKPTDWVGVDELLGESSLTASAPTVAQRLPMVQHIIHAPSTGGLMSMSTRRRARRNREIVRRDGPNEDACRIDGRYIDGLRLQSVEEADKDGSCN